MHLGTPAFLYRESTVVIDKRDIKNAKDEDFTRVSLYLSEEFIRNSYKAIEERLENNTEIEP